TTVATATVRGEERDDADKYASYYFTSVEAHNLNNGSNDITLSADSLVDVSNDDFNINHHAGGESALRAAPLTMPVYAMNTLYLFHPWIEASETGDTVLSLFGQWWDGDAAAPGGTNPKGVFGGLVFGGPLRGPFG